MAAELVSNTVVDQHGQPVASALVTIRDASGALVTIPGESNPVVTDSVGYWEALLDPGTYSLVISKGDDYISRTESVCVGSSADGALTATSVFRIRQRFIVSPSMESDVPATAVFRDRVRFIASPTIA
jgi:hypothetical protein